MYIICIIVLCSSQLTLFTCFTDLYMRVYVAIEQVVRQTGVKTVNSDVVWSTCADHR